MQPTFREDSIFQSGELDWSKTVTHTGMTSLNSHIKKPLCNKCAFAVSNIWVHVLCTFKLFGIARYPIFYY